MYIVPNDNSVTTPNTIKSEIFQGQKEKFKKEAKRMFAIKNEHIVGVHDLFEENGTAYYVMDYVDGENLAERLRRTGKPMTESEVNQILPQILDALKSVHDAGIWHLDLKPANIMIDKSGQVKLIDFGASKQLNAQKGGATTSTAISYTNGYAPREQMEQNYDKFGPWTDIYALGATLYNLLTNKRPPLPTDIDDDISEDKHNALPFSESVSEDMKRNVLWMMGSNRMQRPQSVSAIHERNIEKNSFKYDIADNNEETIVDKPIQSPTTNIRWKQKHLRLKEGLKSLNKYRWIAIIVSIIVMIGLLYKFIFLDSTSSAHYEMGERYYNGIGVNKDYYEAVKWYKKAAEKGNAKAQSKLGICYSKGEGVSQDHNEAVKWYKKAAEQGEAEAQNNLGICYYDGTGVSKDYDKAVKWFKKAAKQGNEFAQNNLGICYFDY